MWFFDWFKASLSDKLEAWSERLDRWFALGDALWDRFNDLRINVSDRTNNLLWYNADAWILSWSWQWFWADAKSTAIRTVGNILDWVWDIAEWIIRVEPLENTRDLINFWTSWEAAEYAEERWISTWEAILNKFVDDNKEWISDVVNTAVNFIPLAKWWSVLAKWLWLAWTLIGWEALWLPQIWKKWTKLSKASIWLWLVWWSWILWSTIFNFDESFLDDVWSNRSEYIANNLGIEDQGQAYTRELLSTIWDIDFDNMTDDDVIWFKEKFGEVIEVNSQQDLKNVVKSVNQWLNWLQRFTRNALWWTDNFFQSYYQGAAVSRDGNWETTRTITNEWKIQIDSPSLVNDDQLSLDEKFIETQQKIIDIKKQTDEAAEVFWARDKSFQNVSQIYYDRVVDDYNDRKDVISQIQDLLEWESDPEARSKIQNIYNEAVKDLSETTKTQLDVVGDLPSDLLESERFQKDRKIPFLSDIDKLDTESVVEKAIEENKEWLSEGNLWAWIDAKLFTFLSRANVSATNDNTTRKYEWWLWSFSEDTVAKTQLWVSKWVEVLNWAIRTIFWQNDLSFLKEYGVEWTTNEVSVLESFWQQSVNNLDKALVYWWWMFALRWVWSLWKKTIKTVWNKAIWWNIDIKTADKLSQSKVYQSVFNKWSKTTESSKAAVKWFAKEWVEEAVIQGNVENLIEGNIYNTEDFLVNAGIGWFVWTTSNILWVVDSYISRASGNWDTILEHANKVLSSLDADENVSSNFKNDIQKMLPKILNETDLRWSALIKQNLLLWWIDSWVESYNNDVKIEQSKLYSQVVTKDGKWLPVFNNSFTDPNTKQTFKVYDDASFAAISKGVVDKNVSIWFTDQAYDYILGNTQSSLNNFKKTVNELVKITYDPSTNYQYDSSTDSFVQWNSGSWKSEVSNYIDLLRDFTLKWNTATVNGQPISSTWQRIKIKDFLSVDENISFEWFTQAINNSPYKKTASLYQRLFHSQNKYYRKNDITPEWQTVKVLTDDGKALLNSDWFIGDEFDSAFWFSESIQVIQEMEQYINAIQGKESTIDVDQPAPELIWKNLQPWEANLTVWVWVDGITNNIFVRSIDPVSGQATQRALGKKQSQLLIEWWNAKNWWASKLDENGRYIWSKDDYEEKRVNGRLVLVGKPAKAYSHPDVYYNLMKAQFWEEFLNDIKFTEIQWVDLLVEKWVITERNDAWDQVEVKVQKKSNQEEVNVKWKDYYLTEDKTNPNFKAIVYVTEELLQDPAFIKSLWMSKAKADLNKKEIDRLNVLLNWYYNFSQESFSKFENVIAKASYAKEWLKDMWVNIRKLWERKDLKDLWGDPSLWASMTLDHYSDLMATTWTNQQKEVFSLLDNQMLVSMFKDFKWREQEVISFIQQVLSVRSNAKIFDWARAWRLISIMKSDIPVEVKSLYLDFRRYPSDNVNLPLDNRNKFSIPKSLLINNNGSFYSLWVSLDSNFEKALGKAIIRVSNIKDTKLTDQQKIDYALLDRQKSGFYDDVKAKLSEFIDAWLLKEWEDVYDNMYKNNLKKFKESWVLKNLVSFLNDDFSVRTSNKDTKSIISASLWMIWLNVEPSKVQNLIAKWWFTNSNIVKRFREIESDSGLLGNYSPWIESKVVFLSKRFGKDKSPMMPNDQWMKFISKVNWDIDVSKNIFSYFKWSEKIDVSWLVWILDLALFQSIITADQYSEINNDIISYDSIKIWNSDPLWYLSWWEVTLLNNMSSLFKNKKRWPLSQAKKQDIMESFSSITTASKLRNKKWLLKYPFLKDFLIAADRWWYELDLEQNASDDRSLSEVYNDVSEIFFDNRKEIQSWWLWSIKISTREQRDIVNKYNPKSSEYKSLYISFIWDFLAWLWVWSEQLWSKVNYKWKEISIPLEAAEILHRLNNKTETTVEFIDGVDQVVVDGNPKTNTEKDVLLWYIQWTENIDSLAKIFDSIDISSEYAIDVDEAINTRIQELIEWKVVTLQEAAWLFKELSDVSWRIYNNVVVQSKANEQIIEKTINNFVSQETDFALDVAWRIRKFIPKYNKAHNAFGRYFSSKIRPYYNKIATRYRDEFETINDKQIYLDTVNEYIQAAKDWNLSNQDPITWADIYTDQDIILFAKWLIGINSIRSGNSWIDARLFKSIDRDLKPHDLDSLESIWRAWLLSYLKKYNKSTYQNILPSAASKTHIIWNLKWEANWFISMFGDIEWDTASIWTSVNNIMTLFDAYWGESFTWYSWIGRFLEKSFPNMFPRWWLSYLTPSKRTIGRVGKLKMFISYILPIATGQIGNPMMAVITQIAPTFTQFINNKTFGHWTSEKIDGKSVFDQINEDLSIFPSTYVSSPRNSWAWKLISWLSTNNKEKLRKFYSSNQSVLETWFQQTYDIFMDNAFTSIAIQETLGRYWNREEALSKVYNADGTVNDELADQIIQEARDFKENTLFKFDSASDNYNNWWWFTSLFQLNWWWGFAFSRLFMQQVYSWHFNKIKAKAIENWNDIGDAALSQHENIRLVQNMVNTAFYAYRFGRLLAEDEEDNDFAENLSQFIDAMKFLYQPTQAFQSNPWQRTIIEWFNQIIKAFTAHMMSWNEDMLRTDPEKYKWLIRFFDTAMREIWRGFWVSGIASDVVWAIRAWNIWPWEVVAWFLDDINYKTMWLLNFFDQDINNNLWLIMPQSNKSFVESLVTWNEIKDLYWVIRWNISVKDLIDNEWNIDWKEWLTYIKKKLPKIFQLLWDSKYKWLYISDDKKYFKMIDELKRYDETFQWLLKWDLAWLSDEENIEFTRKYLYNYVKYPYSKLSDASLGNDEDVPYWTILFDNELEKFLWDDIYWQIKEISDLKRFNSKADDAKRDELYMKWIATVMRGEEIWEMPAGTTQYMLAITAWYLRDEAQRTRVKPWTNEFYTKYSDSADNPYRNEVDSYVWSQLLKYLELANKNDYIDMTSKIMTNRSPAYAEFINAWNWTFNKERYRKIYYNDVLSSLALADGNISGEQIYNVFNQITVYDKQWTTSAEKEKNAADADALKIDMALDIFENVDDSLATMEEKKNIVLSIVWNEEEIFNKAINDPEFNKVVWPERVQWMKNFLYWTSKDIDHLPKAIRNLWGLDWWYSWTTKRSTRAAYNPSKPVKWRSTPEIKFQKFISSNIKYNDLKPTAYKPYTRNHSTTRSRAYKASTWSVRSSGIKSLNARLKSNSKISFKPKSSRSDLKRILKILWQEWS